MYTDYVDCSCICVSCRSRARAGDQAQVYNRPEVYVVLHVSTMIICINKTGYFMCPVAQMVKACDCYAVTYHKIESSSLSGAARIA